MFRCVGKGFTLQTYGQIWETAVVTEPIGPTLRKRQLADALRQLRLAAGLQVMDAAHALRCSRPKIQHLESGRNLPSYPDLESLLRRYGALDQLDALEEIRVEANARGWWSAWRLPPWLQAYIGLETDATLIRCFDLELIPGLLQTEQYARSLLSLSRSGEEDTTRRVSVLRERQRRVGDGLDLTVVLSEAALWRTLEMGAPGRDQLSSLVAVTESNRAVDLRVLPFTAGVHRGMSGRFAVLSFPPGADPIGYQEHSLGGHLVDEPDVVAKLITLWEDLSAMALDNEDSAEIIAEFAVRAEER